MKINFSYKLSIVAEAEVDFLPPIGYRLSVTLDDALKGNPPGATYSIIVNDQNSPVLNICGGRGYEGLTFDITCAEIYGPYYIEQLEHQDLLLSDDQSRDVARVTSFILHCEGEAHGEMRLQVKDLLRGEIVSGCSKLRDLDEVYRALSNEYCDGNMQNLKGKLRLSDTYP